MTKQTKSPVQLSPFANDVLKGLSSTEKSIPSKYMYDIVGDKIFTQIMQLPEYYLSRAEADILETYKEEFLRICCDDKPFKLIDLGAGDGSKTEILLRYFIKKKLDFEYIAIDISQNALDLLTFELHFKYPKLNVKPMLGDYSKVLSELTLDPTKKMVLFLGSNLGNCDFTESIDFLQNINKNLNKNDLLLLGLDLKKNPETILRAYSDYQGVTSRFNLNLLSRMNKELGANFDLETFQHFTEYNPMNGEVRSYLVSKIPQKVYIEALEKTFCFDRWEAIHTENSNKYDFSQITSLAEKSGFNIVKSFFDSKNYFTDTLWMK
jgi:L-histidine N-alpha-methyltransferase